VLGNFGRTMELTGGTFRVEVHDVVANDEHAVGLHGRMPSVGGRTLWDNTVLVFQMRDGKATEVWQYWADPTPLTSCSPRSDPYRSSSGGVRWPSCRCQ
jgi:ketosteroid isomerase-like protein